MDFYHDLKESCKIAAKFLRNKHLDWNKGKSNKDKIYSGEREFVCEVYRLMVCKDPDYRQFLLVDYMRPDKNEQEESAVPDLVFRGENSEKHVVEIKVIVNKRAWNDPDPYKPYKSDEFGPTGEGGINGDYDQLKAHYVYFKSKILVIAFLGETAYKNGTNFSLEEFKGWVQKKYPETDEIKVIVC